MFDSRLLKSLKSRLIRSPRGLSEAQRRQWEEEGLLILPGLVPPERIDRMLKLIDRLWDERREPANPLVADFYIGTERGRRIHFRDAPDDARNYPYKLNDVYLISNRLRRFVLGNRLQRIIRELLDGDPLICNSLIFERGSQQNFHFDTWYMPPVVENKMLATWIALEDVHDDAGPLSYYPGSHLIPAYKFSHGMLHAVDAEMGACQEYVDRELRSRGLQPVTFRPKAGDVLIWHAQLLHSGLPIKDPARTRRSIVTHYFRAMDMSKDQCREFEPGCYYLKRRHPKVTA